VAGVLILAFQYRRCTVYLELGRCR